LSLDEAAVVLSANHEAESLMARAGLSN